MYSDIWEQDFSTLALLAFGAKWVFVVGGCCVPWGPFNSITDLYLPGCSNTILLVVTAKMTPDIVKWPPGGKADPSWEPLILMALKLESVIQPSDSSLVTYEELYKSVTLQTKSIFTFLTTPKLIFFSACWNCIKWYSFISPISPLSLIFKSRYVPRSTSSPFALVHLPP